MGFRCTPGHFTPAYQWILLPARSTGHSIWDLSAVYTVHEMENNFFLRLPRWLSAHICAVFRGSLRGQLADSVWTIGGFRAEQLADSVESMCTGWQDLVYQQSKLPKLLICSICGSIYSSVASLPFCYGAITKWCTGTKSRTNNSTLLAIRCFSYYFSVLICTWITFWQVLHGSSTRIFCVRPRSYPWLSARNHNFLWKR